MPEKTRRPLMNALKSLSIYSVDTRRYAYFTVDLFARVAHRLGLWHLRWELEEATFRLTLPDQYRLIATAVGGRRENGRAIRKAVDRLRVALEEQNLAAEITGRPKRICSIYRKVQRKGRPLERVHDVRALRVIVEDIPACYRVLSIVHQQFARVAGQLDDYIASPKGNGYRSLHTVLVDNDGNTLEVQIRTQDMHHAAEWGPAAHWRYKEPQPLPQEEIELVAHSSVPEKASTEPRA